MLQFKEKNSNLWKWVLWSGISSFIAVVGWSINHMTPGLLPVAIAMCAAGVAVSFVYTVYTTVNAGSLRHKAWICEALIVVGLGVNVVIHAGLSRRFDVAQQAREARHIEEERDQQRQEAENRRLKERQASEAALLVQQAETLDKQRRATEAQNRQLGMVNRDLRRLPAAHISMPAISSDTMPGQETAPVFTIKKAAPVEMLTPEQVQEMSWSWVLVGILAEVGFIVGTFIYFVRGLIGDTNQNGVADWKEELNPDELAESYPEDYRRLYGPRPRQAPNMSPAPAFGKTRSK